MSDDRHIMGSMATSQAGLIFFELDIEHPVEAVFDAPVVACGLGKGFGVERA